MTRSRLLLAIAGVLAGAGAVFVVLGAVFNPLLAVVALPFGVAAYFLWSDATGRLHRRVRRRVVEGEPYARGRGGPGGDPARGPDGTGWPAEGGPGWWRDGATRWQPTEGPARSMDRREAFAALDLSPDADQGAIRRAYRDRVKAVHPDADGGDEDEFRRVRAAYERLRRGKG